MHVRQAYIDCRSGPRGFVHVSNWYGKASRASASRLSCDAMKSCAVCDVSDACEMLSDRWRPLVAGAGGGSIM